MATYNEMAKKVLDWSNRDTEVLSYANIKDFINYAVDEAYRTLRIAPLENVITYTANTSLAGTNQLIIPDDTIEFIQLRKVDTTSPTNYTTYNARTDIRSFYDEEIFRYDYYTYTRDRNAIIVYPDIVATDVYELYYYRRLPEIDARYDPRDHNNPLAVLYVYPTRAELIQAVMDSESADVFTVDPDLMDQIYATDSDVRLGREAVNWLRDQNEKVILYGALWQAFSYLMEPEEKQQYEMMFRNEIEALNNEDRQRMARGATVNIHFDAGYML